jgi:hypothetical protein
MAENEGRTRGLLRAVERQHGGPHEGRLAGAQLARKRHDIARVQAAGEVRGDASKIVQRRGAAAFEAHGEDTGNASAKEILVSWRANDVLVGVITGVFSAVIASAFEAAFVTLRIVTLGEHGGGLGSKLLFIAILGAIVGGIIGFFVGAVVKPRSQSR